MRTAILIDGGFFIRQYHRLRGSKSPADAAKELHWMCRAHLGLGGPKGAVPAELYRVFYYDCPPLTHKAPQSNHECGD